MESTQKYVAEVNNILISQFEFTAEELKPEANLFADLGLDSLDAIDMVIAFQNKFGIKLKDEDIQSIRTLGDIHKLIERYASNPQAFAAKAAKAPEATTGN